MNKLPLVRVGYQDDIGPFIRVESPCKSVVIYYDRDNCQEYKTLFYILLRAVCDRAVQIKGINLNVVFDDEDEERSFCLLWTLERYSAEIQDHIDPDLGWFNSLDQVIREFPLYSILKSNPRLWDRAGPFLHLVRWEGPQPLQTPKSVLAALASMRP